MKILTSAQMREIDRKTIEEIGIPGPVLMENAGLQVVRAIKKKFPDLKKETFAIVAGKGNNGGDGLVVARHLLNLGASPLILLLAAKDEVRGDAALNLRIAEKIGLEVIETPTPERWQANRRDLLRSTVIIDALFGTGLDREPAGAFGEAIEAVNRAGRPVVAVDIPSGLHADTGVALGRAVRANLTVTFIGSKRGLFTADGPDHAGIVQFEDIIDGVTLREELDETTGLRQRVGKATRLREVIGGKPMPLSCWCRRQWRPDPA